jgi:aldehyde dehydrogenase (NAD+)
MLICTAYKHNAPALFWRSQFQFPGVCMRLIDQIYIDGAFVTPHGTELYDLYNPATALRIGQVRLADAEDARHAIAAAKRAFETFSRTDKAERAALLRRMHAMVLAAADDLTEAIIEE